MENASQALLDIVRKSMRVIRQALGGGDLDPARLTYVERLQYDGYLRRQETDAAIRRLADTGMAIKTIVRATGYSRKTVRQVLRGGRADVFRNRANSLGPWLDALDSEWTAGCRNGAELWRRLKKSGFPGSLRVITEWATRRRRTEAAPDGMPQKCPSARVVARLMTMACDQLSRHDAALVATIAAAAPALTAVRDLVDRFHGMVQRRQSSELPAWIEEATGTALGSFANGLRADQDAVAAALSEPWSNGQTEGQITKLKLVKRQMYGRAKLDLLRARLVPPA
jgi:transposase